MTQGLLEIAAAALVERGKGILAADKTPAAPARQSQGANVLSADDFLRSPRGAVHRPGAVELIVQRTRLNSAAALGMHTDELVFGVGAPTCPAPSLPDD
ncbi:MAG TPA: hypothetical protein VGH03_13955 [Caulobacteraceae bacterium]|jgi:hypothetical protein